MVLSAPGAGLTLPLRSLPSPRLFSLVFKLKAQICVSGCFITGTGSQLCWRMAELLTSVPSALALVLLLERIGNCSEDIPGEDLLPSRRSCVTAKGRCDFLDFLLPHCPSLQRGWCCSPLVWKRICGPGLSAKQLLLCSASLRGAQGRCR